MLGTFGLCRKWRSTTRYDYVTKRPKDIQALRFSADEHGQFAVAGDVGGFLGEDHQFGYRINLVNEQIDSYVDHVDGERYLAALALDWKATAQSKFEFDLEAQRSEQKSVPGYQLLDGKVPQNVKWERLLGYQSWGKPVTIDSLNTSLKYNYAFNDDWNLGLVASHSKSKVDDYSVFPFGYYRDGCEAAYSCNTFSAQVIKTRDTDLDKFLPQFAVSYSSSKYANKQGTAKVSGYSVFDLGAAYQFKLNTTDAQLRFNINNLLNKKYWRDAGEFYGDDYLFLGAPRTATLSLNLNF